MIFLIQKAKAMREQEVIIYKNLFPPLSSLVKILHAGENFKSVKDNPGHHVENHSISLSPCYKKNLLLIIDSESIMTVNSWALFPHKRTQTTLGHLPEITIQVSCAFLFILLYASSANANICGGLSYISFPL